MRSSHFCISLCCVYCSLNVLSLSFFSTCHCLPIFPLPPIWIVNMEEIKKSYNDAIILKPVIIFSPYFSSIHHCTNLLEAPHTDPHIRMYNLTLLKIFIAADKKYASCPPIICAAKRWLNASQRKWKYFGGWCMFILEFGFSCKDECLNWED